MHGVIVVNHPTARTHARSYKCRGAHEHTYIPHAYTCTCIHTCSSERQHAHVPLDALSTSFSKSCVGMCTCMHMLFYSCARAFSFSCAYLKACMHVNVHDCQLHRQGIALRLLDALLSNFSPPLRIAATCVAFSQPTPSGRRLANRFFGTDSFLVYRSAQ